MDRFLARLDGPSKRRNDDDHDEDIDTSPEPPPKKRASGATSLSKYKKKLTYDPLWKKKHPWMDIAYDHDSNKVIGMICTICNAFGNPPVQARGAWVSRPINNWVKATSLLRKHELSEWHLASVEKKALSHSSVEQGNVVQQILSVNEEERKQNRELMKKLVRSLYFLVKHYIAHTTTFEDLLTLQIENGDVKLKSHRDNCAKNATYESYSTIVELLACISKVLEYKLLDSLKESLYFSLLADECTDVSSKEELSVCARWLSHTNKPVEHFLGIIHAKETNAEALSGYLEDFLQSKAIKLENMSGLGFDGTNTMSGHRTGVQKRLRFLSPNALYIHCRCHQLQLAALSAANDHIVVKRVLGTLLTIWKVFHYSPKKAEKLALIQAVLQSPEIKMTKPSDTRWLSRERAVRTVRESLPALVTTFEEIYNETGDAESHGVALLLVNYITVASIYMLCDVLHTVAKLQGSLQGKSIDIASVPAMVNGTITRLKELKDNTETSTWFKNHMNVFSDDSLLGSRNIIITSEEEASFIQQVYRPYIQSVIDHTNARLASTDLSLLCPCLIHVTFL